MSYARAQKKAEAEKANPDPDPNPNPNYGRAPPECHPHLHWAARSPYNTLPYPKPTPSLTLAPIG